jgi:hypothetical protein
MRLFASTAIGIASVTAAYAQSPTNTPSKDSATPLAPQSQPSTSPQSNQPAGVNAPREHSNVKYTERDRDVVRKHAGSHSQRRVAGRTTGSAVRTEIRVGDRVPETVEIETFPDEVHRDAPALREYRYIRGYNSIYLVDPRERMIIEEID